MLDQNSTHLSAGPNWSVPPLKVNKGGELYTYSNYRGFYYFQITFRNVLRKWFTIFQNRHAVKQVLQLSQLVAVG
jgi:hypothetical protein